MFHFKDTPVVDTELWKGHLKLTKDKFPTRAFTLYDSYIHTEFYNNKFFDYPNSGSILIENFQENLRIIKFLQLFSEDRFTSAFGAKMGNKFGMTNFGTKCYNNQFDNVYRRMFMGTLGGVSI